MENDSKYLRNKSGCLEMRDDDTPHVLLNPVKYFGTEGVLLSPFLGSNASTFTKRYFAILLSDENTFRV